MRNFLTLYELTSLVGEAISVSFEEPVKLVAEINTFTEHRSGHVYMELIEKRGENVIAKMRAIIWASSYKIIKEYFNSITGTDLKSGMKILCRGKVHYHNVYGLSFQIFDVDPQYTLGEWELHRQEIINRLERESIIDLNKELSFPLLPQRVAVISSPSAAGFEDFKKHLVKNIYKYEFYYELFEATMQGVDTERSVINALNRVYVRRKEFDVVAIIRGGGSKYELSAFDSYALAKNIANFPLPVLTGIGHQRDITIADMVAYKSLKTPTAVADFLVNRFFIVEQKILHLWDNLKTNVQLYAERQQSILEKLLNQLITVSFNYYHNRQISLENLEQRLSKSIAMNYENSLTHLRELKTILEYSVKNMIQNISQYLDEKERNIVYHLNFLFKSWEEELKNLDKKIDLLDPENVLRRGYSITLYKGKVLKDLSVVKRNDKLETIFINGKIISQVTRIKK